MKPLLLVLLMGELAAGESIPELRPLLDKYCAGANREPRPSLQ